MTPTRPLASRSFCLLALLCDHRSPGRVLSLCLYMDVPPFWPPFLTFWGLNSIFLGYFFSSTNTKTIFWDIRTTNSYKIRSFWPQIPFFPRSLWVQFSAASGTPPSVFGPSTHDDGSEWREDGSFAVAEKTMRSYSVMIYLLDYSDGLCTKRKCNHDKCT